MNSPAPLPWTYHHLLVEDDTWLSSALVGPVLIVIPEPIPGPGTSTAGFFDTLISALARTIAVITVHAAGRFAPGDLALLLGGMLARAAVAVRFAVT